MERVRTNSSINLGERNLKQDEIKNSSFIWKNMNNSRRTFFVHSFFHSSLLIFFYYSLFDYLSASLLLNLIYPCTVGDISKLGEPAAQSRPSGVRERAPPPPPKSTPEKIN